MQNVLHLMIPTLKLHYNVLLLILVYLYRVENFRNYNASSHYVEVSITQLCNMKRVLLTLMFNFVRCFVT